MPSSSLLMKIARETAIKKEWQVPTVKEIEHSISQKLGQDRRTIKKKRSTETIKATESMNICVANLFIHVVLLICLRWFYPFIKTLSCTHIFQFHYYFGDSFRAKSLKKEALVRYEFLIIFLSATTVTLLQFFFFHYIFHERFIFIILFIFTYFHDIITPV